MINHFNQLFVFTCILISFMLLNKTEACCDALPPITDFNASRFAGDWYLSQFDRKQDVKNCIYANFNLVNSTTFNYTQNFRYINGTFDSWRSVYFLAVPDFPLPMSNFGIMKNNRSSQINIIATDYTTYAVLASCDGTYKYGSNVTVLTRSATMLAMEGQQMIKSALDKINFHPSYLTSTIYDQATCNASTMFLKKTDFFIYFASLFVLSHLVKSKL